MAHPIASPSLRVAGPPTDGDAERLPRSFWFLCVGAFINRLGSFVAPFLALYLTEQRGIPLEEAGRVLSSFGVGSLLAGPIGGVLADRIGRRVVLVASLGLSALAMVHLALARAPAHIAVATLVLGCVGDLYRPAMAGTVADVVQPQRRSRAYSLLYWSANLGFSAASIVAGLVVGRSFAPLFVVDAATTLVFAAVVAVGVPAVDEGSRLTPRAPRGAWATPFADSAFLSLVLCMFPLALCFQQFRMALPVDMRAHGVSTRTYGSLIAINGALIVLLTPLAARVSARFRRSRVLAVGSLLSGIGFGANAFIGTVPLYAASIVVWSVGEIALSTVAPAIVADLAPLALRATYQGVFQMAWGAATFVGPAVGGAVMGRFGAGTLWGVCAGLAVVSAVGHLASAGARRRRLRALGVAPLHDD